MMRKKISLQSIQRFATQGSTILFSIPSHATCSSVFVDALLYRENNFRPQCPFSPLDMYLPHSFSIFLIFFISTFVFFISRAEVAYNSLECRDYSLLQRCRFLHVDADSPIFVDSSRERYCLKRARNCYCIECRGERTYLLPLASEDLFLPRVLCLASDLATASRVLGARICNDKMR